MKPHLRIVAGRPVTVRAPDSPRITEARARFSATTGEAHRLFRHELGSRFECYPESVLSRHFRKAEWRNVKHPDSK